ncbi:MAG: hypothetical protein E7440_01655 [Ruminococcaceae bacterium]|nr:hypothetical protein [Oscillospiraceae bacterium]
MKKYTGNYTNEATKALKNSDKIICRTADDGTIYLCNGYFLYKMNPLEYAAVAQAATQCEPGNWIIDKDGKRDEQNFDAVKVFTDAVKAAENAGNLARCPLDLDTGKIPARCYYNAEKDFAAFYNNKFVSAFRSGAMLRSPGPLSAAVAYDNDEPFAMVLPIRPEEKASRAVKAYFTEATSNNESDKLRADLTAANNEIAQANNEIARLREQIAQQAAAPAAAQEAQQAAQEADDNKPQQAPAQDAKTAAELIAARFADMAGVTATIKGAQTAAPVVWLAGDTEKHADAIKAAGAKWSNKKSAFYVRVA